MSQLRSPFARPRPLYMTCDAGFEKLLARELEACGARNLEPGHRGVKFLGIEETMWRANLCSRVGNRVLVPVAEFPAPDKRALYEGAKRIHWSEWFSHDQTFAVDASTHKSKLNHHGYAALVVKDAICDRFRFEGDPRPNVDRQHPDFRINLHVENDRATISMDTSGARLHRRGYRKNVGEAPVKETLAAALILWTQWQGQRAFVDPMCGAGTFLAEAAMIATNFAPGLLRLKGEGFGFMRWRNFNHDKFAQAVERVRKLSNDTVPTLRGFDQDEDMVTAATDNLERLPFKTETQIAHIPVESLRNEHLNLSQGKRLVVTNPPYGHRMGDEVDELYGFLGDTLASTFQGDRKYVLMSEDAPLRRLRQRVKQERWVNNGPIRCRWAEIENRRKK